VTASGLNLDGPIRVILFDLGGTLIYEDGPWEPIFPRANEAMWRVLHAAGVTLGPDELYGESQNLFDMYYLLHRGDLTEPTTAGVLDALLQEKGIHLPKDTLQVAMQAMYGVTQSNWLPETDALPTLQLLRERGFHTGLISNAADDDNTQALVDKGMFRPHLEYIISSAAFGMRKPHPDIFRSALEYFGASPGEAVMVGDNFEADILGAHGVGMQSIWITRRLQGVDPADFEIRPNAVISALSEIPSLLGEE
jgi:HAD superfamily hydrolase (TIGR01509 family)